jgi:uncharacterized protein YbjT (DUF2867 family)
MAVIRKLQSRSVKIRALVRRSEDADRFKALGVESALGDLTQASSLDPACAGIDVVVATATAALPTRRADTIYRVDGQGYRNLIEAAVRAGVQRFVYASVPVMKGERLSTVFRCKRGTEQALASSSLDSVIFRADAFMDSHFAMMGSTIPLRGSESATVLRPFKFAQNYFSRIKNSVEQKHVAYVPGNGSVRHAFIALDDVASYFEAAVFGGPSGIHNIGGPEILTYLDVVRIYERIMGTSMRAQRTPAFIFRIACSVLRPFSPAGSNLMALNYLLATQDSSPDPNAAAEFGVQLTSSETFLRRKSGIGMSAFA